MLRECAFSKVYIDRNINDDKLYALIVSKYMNHQKILMDTIK